MKKIIAIIALGLTAFTGNVVAQNGTITFTTFQAPGNNAGRAFDLDGVTALTGNFKTDIVFTPTSGSAGTTAAQTFGTSVGVTDGFVLAGTIDVVGGGLGATGTYIQRAWEGAFATYDLAVAGGGKFGNSRDHALAGQTGVTPSITLGDRALGTPGTTVGHAGFALVPEPTTMALGLMGLGGLVAARRRRK
jgi:hypothetical protein